MAPLPAGVGGGNMDSHRICPRMGEPSDGDHRRSFVLSDMLISFRNFFAKFLSCEFHTSVIEFVCAGPRVPPSP